MPASQVIISHSLKIPAAELHYRTSRSGGPGGQNVNKLETRVELLFDIMNSPSLSENLRSRLLEILSSNLSSVGILRIVVQDSRSQWKNKQLAVERLTELLKSALVVRKKRTATKRTRSAQENRIRSKKVRGEIKRLRKVTLE